jgi:hypothetical protein
MTPDWAVQSAWLEEHYSSTRLYVRVENTSYRYVQDSLFYAEILDDRRDFCFSALFRLRENREHERGPLKPGGERTLESFSYSMAVAEFPHVIRLYPADRRLQGAGTTIRAPVRIRIPATIWATSFPVPTPEWARLQPWRPGGHSHAPIIDLALAEVDVGPSPMGAPLGMRVLDANSPGVREWIERLGRHLRFDPATDDSAARPAKALILVRAGPLRVWNDRDPSFSPWESPWVKTYLGTFRGEEIPPVSVIALSPCVPDAPVARGQGARPQRRLRGCLQFYGDDTEWSGNVWRRADVLPGATHPDEAPGPEAVRRGGALARGADLRFAGD